MRMPRLQPRDRRALGLGTLVLVPALLFAAVGGPFAATLTDARERLEMERVLLERELALLAAADSFPRLARRQRAQDERARRRLFQEDGSGLPLALEQYVVDRARRSRVYIEQSDSRIVGDPADGLLRMETSVRGIGDFEGILELIYALENGPRLIHVARLALEPVAAPPGAGEERISVSLTASGFALEEPSDSAGVAAARDES